MSSDDVIEDPVPAAWADAARSPRPWGVLAPEATAAFAAAVVRAWETVDPALADLCRCRIAMLLGDGGPAPRAGLGTAHGAQVSELPRWPTSERFGPAERAALAFTEQFVIDVSGMSPSVLGPLADALGDGLAPFAQALFLLDMDVRLGMVLPRLFEVVDVDLEAPAARPAKAPAGAGPDQAPDLWAAIEKMLRAVARLRALDAVTTELVRLRGARHHQCRICQSRLSLSALEAVGDRAVLDQVDIYETSDLPERQKVALRLTDAFLTQPSTLDGPLAAAVRAHFTPAEAVEIVYDVARNATNKFAVALGVDAPQVEDGVELFDVDEQGDVVAAADPDELRRLLAGV